MTSLSSYFTNRLSSIAVRVSLSRITHYALYTDHTLHTKMTLLNSFSPKINISVNKTGGERLMIFFLYKFENMFC